MLRIWIIFAVINVNSLPVSSITNTRGTNVRFLGPVSTRNFRHVSVAQPDWEDGLREATTQALIRERFADPNLRKHVYSAPLIGKEDKATPFGDIAVVARGQLYATYAGFVFVQDPYENDCEECHNNYPDCHAGRCEVWRPKNDEKLMALWTVKRIRHRETRATPHYEMEFTISPQHRVYRQLIQEGKFNYAAPGHVFVMRQEGHRNNPNHDLHYPLREGAFVAQTSDGQKYILHSFPGFYTPHPKYPVGTTGYPEEQEDERKVYQTLLDIINKKTVEPHRFFPATKTTLAENTLVQLPNGQLVPITQVTKTTPIYAPQSQSQTTQTRPIPIYTRPVTPTAPKETYSTPSSTPKVPVKTTFHFFSAADDEDLEEIFQPSTKRPLTSFVQSEPTTTASSTTKYFRPSTSVQQEQSSYPITTVEVLPSTRIPVTLNEFSKRPGATTIEFLPSTSQFTTTNKETTNYRQPTLSDLTTLHESTPYYRQSEQTSFRYSTTGGGGPSTVQLSTAHQYEEPSSVVAKLTTQHYSTQPPTTRYWTTPAPSTGSVETSVGVTRIMGVTRNDTTDTVYIATEDNEISGGESSRISTTTATPQRIVTTISANGKVSITTSPIFGTKITETSTRRQRTRTTTEKSNFLIDAGVESSKGPSYLSSAKDYNEDEIFGTVKPSITKPSYPKKVTKEYTKSDVEVALFGRDRRQKLWNRATNSSTDKPIRSYSRIYEVPTSPMTLPMTSASVSSTTAMPPVTRQSYKTSISFEVNKRKNTGTLKNVTGGGKNESDKEVTRTLDEFAMKLVNHAKGIEILSQTSTTTTKKPKYMRRRNYIPKSKRPVRKKTTQPS